MAQSQTHLKRPASFNFATSVVDRWARHPRHRLTPLIALHWVSQDLSTSRKLTYAHFSRQSHRIASLLRETLDVGLGETCIVILPRVPEWWEVATGALRSGVVICPCTTLLVDRDIEYRVKVAQASVFIGDETSVRKVLKVRDQCPSLKTVIQIGGEAPSGVVDFHHALEKIPQDKTFPKPEDLKVNSPALIFFTSGTTGPPKMVLHNQISYPLAHTLTGQHWLQLEPGKLYWNLSEQGWAKAAWSFFGTWNCGAALFVVDDRAAFNPIKLLTTLNKFHITTLCAPPTAYRQLVLDESREFFQNNPPAALKHCTGAGEPLNESVIRTWEKMTGGMQIFDGYGQTETILICANQRGNPVKPGSMGKPVPGVPLIIIDAEGAEVERGVEGDIAIRIDKDGGDGMGFFGIFDGYIDKETGKLDRRIKSFGKREYYVTGDRATRDEDGYFWFVGRSDDVINSSGYRIGPFEVESTLKLHPWVVESAVVASPDPHREEVVKAFVVLTASASSRLEKQSDEEGKQKMVAELQNFCKQNAAPYKYPRKVEFVDAAFLPKTISGKIKRAELKKAEWDRWRREKGGKL